MKKETIGGNVTKNKILVLDDIISESDCKYLISLYEEKGPTHEWSGTYPMSIGNCPISQKIHPFILKIQDSINEYKNLNVKVDWCEIVKWPANSFKQDHYDSSSDQTVFASITYLNDDYSGGETYLVNDLVVKPKRGRVIAFDGQQYLHGVSRVSAGDRYTIAIWYK